MAYHYTAASILEHRFYELFPSIYRFYKFLQIHFIPNYNIIIL